MSQVAATEITAPTTVRDAAAGDRAAFAQLIARHHARMTRVAHVITGDADSAADAVQSAWEIAWRRLGSLREPHQVGSWLVAIAANEARQSRRRQRRHTVVDISNVLDLAGAPDPGDSVALVDLKRAMADLNADDRMLLALRFVGNLDSETIARHLGISASGARSRLMRLLEKLRVELEPRKRGIVMTAQRSFEDHLASAFDIWADEAVVEVDATTLAAVVAAGASRRRPVVSARFGLRRSWLMPLALTLLLLAVLASAAIVGSVLLRQQHRYDGFYVPAPDMSIARDQPVVVGLRDGRVLIAGGQPFSVGDPTSLELFDPSTGNYEQFSGDIPVGVGAGIELGGTRVFLVATEIQNQLPQFYVVDLPARVSQKLPAPAVALGQYGTEPAIVRLLDGSVLIAGGIGDPQTTALLFDPAHNSLTQTGSMNEPRLHEAMTLLPDGGVLVAGGISGHMSEVLRDDAEIYDPTTGVFTLAGQMPTVLGPAWAMTLPDGRAMVIHAGATDSLFGEGVGQSSTVDFYDPASKTFEAGSPPNLPGQASFTALPDGRVLLTGSQLPAATDASSVRRVAWSAIYDPIAGTLSPLGDPRAIFPSGAVLPDGRVLLAGGYYDSDASSNKGVPWVEVLR